MQQRETYTELTMPVDILTPQEMTASVRGAIGDRGDKARGLGLTGERSAVLNAAVAHVSAGRGQEALVALAGGSTDFTRGGYEPVLQTKIYTGFAPDGTRIAATPAETARYTQIRDAVRTYEDYVTRGYDRLTGTPIEVTRKRNFLRDSMNSFLVSNPTFRDALAPAYARNTIPTAIVEEALRDEGLGRKLASILNTRLTLDAAVATGADELFATRTARQTAIQARDQLISDRDRQNDQFTQTTHDRNNFNTAATYTVGSIAGRPPETRASALVALESNIATSPTGDVQIFRRNLDKRNRIENELRRTPPPGNADDLRRELVRVNTGLTTTRADPVFGARCGEFEALYGQANDIEAARDTVSREITRLNGEIAVQDIAVARAQAELDTRGLQRQAGSGDFGLSIQGALGEAAKQHFAKKAGDFITNYRTDRDKAISDAAKEHEKQMDQYMERRWVNSRPRSFLHQWRGDKESINGKQAKRDFSTFTGRGADALITDILRGSGISPAQQALMMEDMEDNGFMDRKRKEVVGKMLAAYVVSGGKLKKGQIDALAVSAYGKEAITTMKTEDDSAKSRTGAAIDARFTKGVPKDLRERMIQGAPGWLATKTTLQILLSPMRLLRPGAIGMGKLTGTIDIT